MPHVKGLCLYLFEFILMSIHYFSFIRWSAVASLVIDRVITWVDVWVFGWMTVLTNTTIKRR